VALAVPDLSLLHSCPSTPFCPTQLVVAAAKKGATKSASRKPAGSSRGAISWYGPDRPKFLVS
jgi:hypothetical protein